MRKPAPRTSRSAFRVLHSALALVLMAAAATAGAATYYASPTGAADAACTADDPGTVAAAIGKAAKRTSWDNGDEVVLLAGTYNYSDPHLEREELRGRPPEQGFPHNPLRERQPGEHHSPRARE